MNMSQSMVIIEHENRAFGGEWRRKVSRLTGFYDLDLDTTANFSFITFKKNVGNWTSMVLHSKVSEKLVAQAKGGAKKPTKTKQNSRIFN